MAHTCWLSGSTGSSESLHPAGYGSSARPSGRYRERQFEGSFESSLFFLHARRLTKRLGGPFQKFAEPWMAEQKRHRDVPQGAFFGKALPSASAPKSQVTVSGRIIQTKTPPTANGGGVFKPQGPMISFRQPQPSAT